MKKKAIEALIEMGMPANTRGFKYIVEIIEKYEEDEEWMYGKLTLLYEVVGKKRWSALYERRALYQTCV